MAAVIKDIKLDFLEENNVVVLAKQEDAGSRFIRVTFAEEGKPFPIAGASYVTLNVKKNDGHVVKSEGIVNDDGTATVPLVSQMLAVDGDAKADVSVFGIEPKKLTTMSFTVRVQESSIPDGTEISTDEFNDLITALAEIAGFAGVRDEVEDARGTYGTVEERLDDVDADLYTHTGDIAALGGRTNTAENNIATIQTKDNTQDVQLSMLTQQLADANKTIANMSDGRITVDGGYGNISALPKTAAIAAMNSILYGMTVTPLVAQAAVAVVDTVSFASVLNSKYYDSLHKTILTGTGSTMTVTNDTAAAANVMVIDLTAFGLATLTAAQCQAAFPSFFTGTQSAQVTCVEATGKNLFDKSKINKGYYLDLVTGNPVVEVSYYISDFIPVIEGKTYYFPDRQSTRTKFFDSNKKALTTVSDAPGNGAALTPVGAKYVRITMSNLISADTFQFESGSTATTYETYKLTEQYIEPYNLRRHTDGTSDTIDTAKNEYIQRLDASGAKLTTPTTTKGIVTGIILSRPNDTIIFGNKHSYTSMVVDGKLPTRTGYADIGTVERLEKLNADGTLTPLDITLATIATDKRSISHPQLANGDISRCKYAYSFGGVNGRKDISYVTGANLVTDSVTGKVYKVGKAIANGVMTDIMTEVV